MDTGKNTKGVRYMIWTTAKVSEKYELNRIDLIAWFNNALWFLGPTLIVLLPSITGAIPGDWKYAAVTIYVLNRLTDLIRRFLQGK